MGNSVTMRRRHFDTALALFEVAGAAVLGVGLLEPGIPAIVFVGRLSGAVGLLLSAWLLWTRHRHPRPAVFDLIAGALVVVSVVIYLARLP